MNMAHYIIKGVDQNGKEVQEEIDNDDALCQ